MNTAHLLLQADVGRALEVAAFVRALPCCTTAVVTSGPYDVVAVVDLTVDALPRVVAQARRAPGLGDLRVCASVDAPAEVPVDVPAYVSEHVPA